MQVVVSNPIIATAIFKEHGGKTTAPVAEPHWRRARALLGEGGDQCSLIVAKEAESFVWATRNTCELGQDVSALTSQLRRQSTNVAARLVFSQRYGAADLLDGDLATLQAAVAMAARSSLALRSSRSRGAPDSYDAQTPAEQAATATLAMQRDVVLDRLLTAHRVDYEELKRSGKIRSLEDAVDIGSKPTPL